MSLLHLKISISDMTVTVILDILRWWMPFPYSRNITPYLNTF